MAGIPLGEWSGSDATNALHAAIEKFQTRAEEQTNTMIRLTRAIVALTVVMLFGLGVQIGLALWLPPHT